MPRTAIPSLIVWASPSGSVATIRAMALGKSSDEDSKKSPAKIQEATPEERHWFDARCARLLQLRAAMSTRPVTFVWPGDLHLESAERPNYKTALWMADEMNDLIR